jgi:hypothetical protein
VIVSPVLQCRAWTRSRDSAACPAEIEVPALSRWVP